MKPKDPLSDTKASLLDRYIRVSSDMYHLGLADDISRRIELLMSPGNAAKESIAFLKSQYRRSEILDHWAPLEIALFTAGIARFGRDWQSVKSILPQKTAPEMSEFYYSVWKGSAMGEACRKLRKQRGLDLG